ncbi:MAG: DivIVA domain-containing protein [Pseudonocardiaceae bacterium]
MHRPQDDVVPLHEPFETALRGFNRQQVLAYIESLDDRITMVAKDRESALAQVAELSRALDQLREESELLAHLRQETEKVNKQAELMAHAPIVGASARIQRIVRLAEEEAAELRARAEQEAAEHRKRATHEAELLLRNMSQRCKQLEADSERRRKEAEQNTEREIARKETEAADRIRIRDQSSLAGLYLLLKIVGPQLAERVCAVERMEAELAESRTRTTEEVAALLAFRVKVTAQLSTTRQVLAEVLARVQQTGIDDLEPVHQPVPIQRDGHPAGEPSVESRITSKS